MSEKATIQREQSRVLRGRIIRTLDRYFGTGNGDLPLESIRHCVDRTAWTAEQIRGELRYLIEAGYVQEAKRPRDYLDQDPFISFRLTAKGKQLVGGEIEDKSIEVTVTE